MLDHIGFPVADFARSRAFYTAALAPLKYKLVVDIDPAQAGGEGHAGFGFPGKPQFWIGTGEPIAGRLHVAFLADDRSAVDAFYQAALTAGGKDNGAPGMRPEYHANYYAAFVLDPDGHNIEAVCHFPGRFQDQFNSG
jgi:catechol 2,3-dioxygenase-like lactoylglutathione lyase family enzyme